MSAKRGEPRPREKRRSHILGPISACFRQHLLEDSIVISLLKMHYHPHPEECAYQSRAQTQSDEHAEVSVAVLTVAECRRVFGVHLAKRGIQAVWIRVTNRSTSGTRVLMTKIARDYYTAREAAGVCHFSILKRLVTFGLMIWFLLPLVLLALPFKLLAIRRANQQMIDCFQKLGFPLKNIPAGTVAEGIVFTPLEFGTKVVDVGLIVNRGVKDYLFSIAVPGPGIDYDYAILESEKTADPVACDHQALMSRLSEMPPATSDTRARRQGDPVNLIVIGEFSSVLVAFASRWDQTEIISMGSCWRTVKSFLLGTEYRYSPVSALYLFRRSQDFALQRVRESINERIHLRLWSTPLRFENRPVWVGQVSRDIGVRFTWRTWNLTTHRIDPDVDEARDYVVEDLFEAGNIMAAGYVGGVGTCSRTAPRRNLTGDPYFTDGQRAVIIISEERTVPKILDWNQALSPLLEKR
jgi:LssY C-terminus